MILIFSSSAASILNSLGVPFGDKAIILHKSMKPIKSLITNLSNQIKLLSSKLGKAPTFLFLLGYLLLIFVFSLVYYYALPGKHFYHSTSQYEYEFFNNDANEILRDIRAEIIQNFLDNGEAKQEINGWRIDINDLETHSLFVGNFPSEFSFQIRLPTIHATQGIDDSWTSISAKVTVFTDGKIRMGDTVLLFFKVENNFNFPLEGFPSPDILFPYKTFDQQQNAVVLPLSLDLYNRIIGFGQGYRGFPSNVSGQYWRMLYFSTGVATSSAFGDVVPVSTQARSLVTLEALLAVIFIGLFLNGLAYDVGEALKNTQSSDEKTEVVSNANEKRPTQRAADGGDSARLQASSAPKKNPAPKQSSRSSRRR